MASISFKVQYSEFAVSLREEVNEYFKKQNLSKTGNWRLYSKTIILFSIAITCYGLLVFGGLHWAINLGLCAILGIDMAAIGFNVMHDGAHGSYSKKQWINDAMAYSLNLMGGSSFLWKMKHNVIHHNLTNLEGHDDDIDIRPLIRTNLNQPKKWVHKYQHYYFIFLYSLTSVWWVYVRDFMKYFSKKIAGQPLKNLTVKEHIIFWVSKLIYFFLFLAVPIYFLGVGPTMIGYFTMLAIQGVILAIVFQLAHVVEDTTFPMPDAETNKVDNTVVMHQMETTANFCTKNKFMHWYTGGLNFQIEHHLFPKISHVHYDQLSRIVQDQCKKYNIQYKEYPTFFQAVKSHFLHLKMVGRA
jgi:linoleoyl-CoA desaturase